jgi:hypothetical protein
MKSDLVAILIAAAIGGAIWIEHDQRVVIDAPVIEVVAPVVAACPDNDAVPYTASCIAYLKISAPQ